MNESACVSPTYSAVVWFNLTAQMVKYMRLNLTCYSSRQLRILVWGSGASFYRTQGSPVVRLKRDDINRQILAQALAFGGMELIWILCSCAPEISAWFWLGCLVDYYPQCRVSHLLISTNNASYLLIPDIAIPWLTDLWAGAIHRYQCGWFMNPDARKLYKKTRQNRQKGIEFGWMLPVVELL